MLRTRLLLRINLGLLLPVLAAAKEPFSIEQVMSAPFASELTAAPKSERIAWLENERGRRNIWVATAPGWKAQKVTSFDNDDGQEIADIDWSPDGTYLLFARGGDFEKEGENPNPGLELKRPGQAIWRVALDGSQPKKLADGRQPKISPRGDLVAFIKAGQIYTMKPSGEEAASLTEQKGSQSDIRWAPDGSAFAFVSERRDHSFIGVYRLADKSLHYLDASVDQDGEPAWSPDSRRLAHLRLPASRRSFFTSQREGEPWSIRVVDIATGAASQVFCAAPGQGSVFHEIASEQQLFWADGDRLIFPWERTGWTHLYSTSTAGGSPVELTPGDGEVEHVGATGDGKALYYSTNIGDIDRRHIWRVSVGGGAPQEVTTGSGIEWSPVAVGGGGPVAFLASSYNERSHVAMQSRREAAKAVEGVEVPSGFPGRAFVKPQNVAITAADGMQIHGQLFLPPHLQAGSRNPAVVFFHGGSRRQMLLGFHYMYYYSNAYSMNQFLASKGYVVLSVNYRSGIGYGLNFREAIHYGAGGGSEFNDVIGAGLYLKSRSDVDPLRIGVWGGSYGGYLTAMALSRASDLFAAGVDYHGVHDWSTLRGYLSSDGKSGDPEDVKRRQEAARIAFESSPMASVDTWRSPVLLIHGDDDRNVDFDQTVMLAEALRERHVAFEQLIFPNEIHDFLLHKDWLQAYGATADFLDRKLGVRQSGPERP